MKKTFITCNVDASWKEGYAGLAFWIVYNNPEKITIKENASCMTDSSVAAELAAINRSIDIILERAIPGDIVVVNSDCQAAIQKIANDQEKIERKLNKKLIIKKVKGHTRGHDPRHWVNNWCDVQAKSARISLEQSRKKA